MIGIYFLKKNKEVVYVGQSIDIERRVKEHSKEKEFDDYSYIECDKSLLNSMEQSFILQYNPKLNIAKYEISTIPKKIYPCSDKILRVPVNIHKIATKKADENGMTLKGYITHLIKSAK